MNSFLCDKNESSKKLFYKVEQGLIQLTKNLKISSFSPSFLWNIVIPISAYFDSLPKKETPYFICLTGGQGSGKTTLSRLIQLVLQEGCNKRTTGFSIDDIYKTKEERKSLASSIHPLCKVRGVPGTHDIKLGLDTLNSLSNATSSTYTPIPVFSKPLDEHLPKEKWYNYKGRPDYIFFDAWCGGARPVPEKKWKPPMNKLEKEEDPDGVWSKWSNKELEGTYQGLFNKFDLLLLIQVPNMRHVYESRWLQEQTLAKTLKDSELKKLIMNKKEVYRFVMHYERLTRYIMEEMPAFADIILERDKEFNFSINKAPQSLV